MSHVDFKGYSEAKKLEPKLKAVLKDLEAARTLLLGHSTHVLIRKLIVEIQDAQTVYGSHIVKCRKIIKKKGKTE